MLSIKDSGLHCLKCGYNLTGLTGSLCPECGWTIDWAQAADCEATRAGTYAHRSQGISVIAGTIRTVLQMLVTPWKFARELRSDEALIPSACVALFSYAWFVVHSILAGDKPGVRDVIELAATIACVMVFQTIVFATLNFRAKSALWSWPRRVRLWWIVSCYSTIFVASWKLVGGPPIAMSWYDTNFYWPLNRPSALSGIELGTTIIFYWWWVILATVLLVRHQPKWLAAIGIPLVFINTWLAPTYNDWCRSLFR